MYQDSRISSDLGVAWTRQNASRLDDAGKDCQQHLQINWANVNLRKAWITWTMPISKKSMKMTEAHALAAPWKAKVLKIPSMTNISSLIVR